MMKKIVDKTDWIAGIIALIAFIAIICELVWGGFSKESIVGGIKDMAGILADVIVLVVAASVFIHKPMNFKEKFKMEMDTIKEKYNPLIIEGKKEKEGVIRYDIASNLSSLFAEEAKEYKRIIEISESEPDKIYFYINKSFFGKRGEEFDAKSIADEIALKMQKVFKEYDVSSSPNGNNYEICVDFNRKMNTNDDVNNLSNLIDYTMFLFVARNKS